MIVPNRSIEKLYTIICISKDFFLIRNMLKDHNMTRKIDLFNYTNIFLFLQIDLCFYLSQLVSLDEFVSLLILHN